jgi:hypothetical protein
MLASITPLGERSRGFSWKLTASAFAVGSIAAAAAAGAGAGAIGSLLPDTPGWRPVALLIVLAVTVSFDASPLGRWLPTSRRQVNEDWLGRYRGWVYGLGFGAQLGAGIATIVTSAAVYAALVVALLTGSARAGLIIGACGGMVRALTLLPARSAIDRDSLVALHRRLASMELRTRHATRLVELAALAVVAGWLA